MLKKLILFIIPLSTFVLNAYGSNHVAPVEKVNRSNYKIAKQVTPPASSKKEMHTNVTNHKAKATTTKVTKKEVNKTKDLGKVTAIPRDSNNKPIYSKIDRGFYDENTYVVRKGDTLFLIAYISDKDVKELASLNNLKEPYPLKVGQKIKLSEKEKKKAPPKKHVEPKVPEQPKKVIVQKPKNEPEITYTKGANGTLFGSDGSVKGPIKASAGDLSDNVTTNVPSVTPTVSNTLKWQWPTSGKIIKYFSSTGDNKGIDIAGSKGQAIKSVANGKVVYAGNALRGYGNLIIIKHNDDYLSAYAHNDEILVKEQQDVIAGQKIAKMGNTEASSTKLHFEIRYKGKSVDPMRYLPKR